MISSYFLMTISIFLCLEYCDVGSKGVMSYFRCIGKYHSGNIYYWQFVVSLLLLNPLLSIFQKLLCRCDIFLVMFIFNSIEFYSN